VARVPLTQVVARASVLALALSAFGAATASAQVCSKTWSSSDGSWASAADWIPAGVPGPNDDVCLTGPGAYTVTVPAIAGGAQARSLTVGDAAGGAKVLEIDGQSVPNGGVTQRDTPLTVANGGTIAANGRIVLNATDGGTTRTPGEIAGGSATLAGGTFTNEGTILAQSSSPRMQKDYLRAPIVNAAGGTVEVTSGLLWYDSGATFQNNGAVRAVGTGNLVFTTDPALSATPTRMVNAGSVLTNGRVQMELAGWTQAGGSVTGGTGEGVHISNGALDYQSGTGDFILSQQLGGSATGYLSGTIPAGQTVRIEGGSSGPAESPPWTEVLTGAAVVNRGTLWLVAANDTPDRAGGAAIVSGAQLLNYGTINAAVERYADGYDHADYLRMDVTNEPGGVISIGAPVAQDSGTSFINHRTVTLYADYVLSRRSGAPAPSTFTNAPDGTIAFSVSSARPPTFEIQRGATFVAGGTVLPALAKRVATAQGLEFALFPIVGGTFAGRFASVGGGFSADYRHAGYVGVVYGTTVGSVSPGRGSLSVRLSCPADGPTCPRATIRATVRGVLVATRSGAVGAGRTKTFALRLNRVGRRLLAHSPGPLAVRVVVTSHGRTLATRSARVLRL
jgi:hypothetical protein